MGVKVARIAAAPEVLAEAINTRFHEGKPTWVWDEPAHPLDAGHLFWSDDVARVLGTWEHMGGVDSPTITTKKPRSGGMSGRKTLRGGRK